MNYLLLTVVWNRRYVYWSFCTSIEDNILRHQHVFGLFFSDNNVKCRRQWVSVQHRKGARKENHLVDSPPWRRHEFPTQHHGHLDQVKQPLSTIPWVTLAHILTVQHLIFHIIQPNVVSPLNPSSLPYSGPAQLLMSRLYNKPENSDVLLNVRRQEQMRLRGTGGPNMVGRTSTFWVIHHSCFDSIHNFQKFEKVQKIDKFRYAVNTGPSTCGHMISPLGHLVLHSTGPDWPHKFKSCFADISFSFSKEINWKSTLLKTVLSICSKENDSISEILSGPPKFDPSHWKLPPRWNGWSTHFWNITTSLDNYLHCHYSCRIYHVLHQERKWVVIQFAQLCSGKTMKGKIYRGNHQLLLIHCRH